MFNVKLPPDHSKVIVRDKLIGYVWPLEIPSITVDPSSTKFAKRLPRYASMTLDGVLVSRNSRTRREAIRTLQAGVRRKVTGGVVPTNGGR